MSVNKVILLGHVVQDPTVKTVGTSKVANFSLATTKKGYEANGTTVPDRTEWHNIVCWRGLADVVERFVKKGSQLYIEGEIRTRSWEQDGGRRYVTEIFVEDMQMVGKRESEQKAEEAREVLTESTADYPKDDLPF